MFAKEQRANSRDINNLLKKHHRNFSEFFKLLSFPFPTLRSAVVISKKTIKRRVDRNRQKRRVVHVLKDLIPPDTSAYCVLWVQKDTSVLSHAELYHELKRLLEQSKIL